VVLTETVKAGDTFQIAVFGINGPDLAGAAQHRLVPGGEDGIHPLTERAQQPATPVIGVLSSLRSDDQPSIVAASLLCERFHTSCVFV